MPGVLHTPSKILVGIDDQRWEHTNAATALRWTARNLAGNEFHLVMVVPPVPMAPLAAVAGVFYSWDQQRKRDEEQACQRLRNAAQLLVDLGIPRGDIRLHTLPAAGGASGVAESIVAYSKPAHMDMMVLGTRGAGSLKKSLLSLVGLGSVSDYCVDNLRVPVIVVRPDVKVAETSGQNRTVCVAYDGSPPADHALVWALHHVLHGGDTLHIISVAPPVPHTVVRPTSADAPNQEPVRKITSDAESLEYAEKLAYKADWAAVQKGWSADALVTGSVPLKGTVGQTICNYAKDKQVDLLVAGARGLGAFKRSVMSLVGLGSVSDYLVHNVTSCPVAVVKASAADLAEELQAEPPTGPMTKTLLEEQEPAAQEAAAGAGELEAATEARGGDAAAEAPAGAAAMDVDKVPGEATGQQHAQGPTGAATMETGKGTCEAPAQHAQAPASAAETGSAAAMAPAEQPAGRA